MTRRYIEELVLKTRFENYFRVDRDGMRGALALFWSKGLRVTICLFSKYHVDCIIEEDVILPWCFTGFYGDSKVENHHISWTILKRLADLNSLPLVVGGDYNAILKDKEK